MRLLQSYAGKAEYGGVRHNRPHIVQCDPGGDERNEEHGQRNLQGRFA
ncbi:MAG: hypothetical protein ACYC9O_11535 [Candidatus Latescibacterota bacterium]